MTQIGDDCYFYYYSTCVKGDTCPFRHQPAALGCELTCSLWEKGLCFKKACTFRHMLIEKDRRTIPCLWESRPSGCTKPYCPYQHTKPKNPNNPIATTQSIPILGPMPPGQPANVGRGGPGIRPPMFNNNPPRHNMPPGQGPFMGGPRPMQQRPMGYQGFLPHNRPSNPFVYQMHPNNMAAMTPYPGMMMPNMMMNQQRGDYMMGRRPQERPNYDDSDDDYTSSDYSDVSISDDERRARSRESTRRRVQSPRSSSRREVRQRSDRDKKTESRSSRENYSDRKESRRRYDSDKERSKRDSDRSRNKPRKPTATENKESTSSEKKKESSDEKTKTENDENQGDIKVKTLEEILREKALKNLHERTAQKKKMQMQTEKTKQDTSDDSPEPIIKSVVSVNKVESTSSPKVSESRDSDDEIEFVKEKRGKSPKTIILDILDPDKEATNIVTTTRQVKVKTEDNKAQETVDKEEKDSDSTSKASKVLNIKVKTFEEIMEEKRQRKTLETKESKLFDNQESDAQESREFIVEANKESNEEVKEQASRDMRTVSVESKLTRKIRVVKKENKDQKAAGSVILRRKVETSPIKKGVINEVKNEDQEEKKQEPHKKLQEPTKKIVIKSFDEIMREKRLRRQNLHHNTQETTTTTASTAKRPSIIRKKQITLALNTAATTTATTIAASTASVSATIAAAPTGSSNAPHRTFKSRKLKVIGRQGLSSTITRIGSVSEPASPSQSNPLSPTSTKSEPTTPTSPAAPSSPVSSTQPDPSIDDDDDEGDRNDDDDGNDGGDNDDSDDDSWEHEELPAVPLETPTLEGPAQIPDIPQDTTVLHIPGKIIAVNQGVSPTKRPRSSLEEIFGVPCDDTDLNPSKDSLTDDEEKDVSPAKKVKTNQETYQNIVEAVNKEMSKKDDFDLDLEDEIANLQTDKSFDANESFNEDDLLLELEEMINN